MLDKKLLSRREVLEKCLVLGGVTLASTHSSAAMLLAFEEKELCGPTPQTVLGPFYKKAAPQTANLRPTGDPGMPLSVSGGIFNTRGERVSNAVIEVWQTDHYGHYDLDGYRYRAKLPANNSASYTMETVMPGHYPARVCQHIHYLVTAPGHKSLVTQLYFATDPAFEGEPDKNFQRDPLIPSRELVRPIMLIGEPKEIHAVVNFELCLERL